MTQQTLTQLNGKDMFKVNRLTSEQQSVDNCFNLICWLKINHDRLQAIYKMTLFHQNRGSSKNKGVGTPLPTM